MQGGVALCYYSYMIKGLFLTILFFILMTISYFFIRNFWIFLICFGLTVSFSTLTVTLFVFKEEIK
jgi:hypothetical protein